MNSLLLSNAKQTSANPRIAGIDFVRLQIALVILVSKQLLGKRERLARVLVDRFAHHLRRALSAASGSNFLLILRHLLPMIHHIRSFLGVSRATEDKLKQAIDGSILVITCLTEHARRQAQGRGRWSPRH